MTTQIEMIKELDKLNTKWLLADTIKEEQPILTQMITVIDMLKEKVESFIEEETE